MLHALAGAWNERSIVLTAKVIAILVDAIFDIPEVSKACNQFIRGDCSRCKLCAKANLPCSPLL